MNRTINPKIVDDKQNDLTKKWIKRGALLGGVAVLGLFSGCQYYSIPEYQRAVVTRAGNVQQVSGPGPHMTMPFVDSVYRYLVNIVQFTTPQLNTYTVDNQEVDAVLVVQMMLPATKDDLAWIFSNVGSNVDDVQAKVQSMVIDRWKIEAGKVNVDTIANNRGKLINDVRNAITKAAKDLYRVNIIDVQLNNLEYQKSYREAQAQAAIVKTQIEQAEGKKRQAVIDAERVQITASGEANRAIEEARGRAQSVLLEQDARAKGVILLKEAEAKGITLTGAAEAQAKQLMADALAKNPQLVQYEQVMRWNGTVPQNMYAGAPIPFVLPQQAK